MLFKCDRCGWEPRGGSFFEVHEDPYAIGNAKLAAYLEVDHFLSSGCRGSVGVYGAFCVPGGGPFLVDWRLVA